MAGRISEKRVVVVGAGQTPGETIGNGRAIALLCAKEGGRVMCVDRVQARAEETATMIREAGGHAFAYQADIAVASQVQAIIQEAQERLGGLDILVNNVGVGLGGPKGDGPAHLASEAAFDKIIQVNLKGMWLTIKAAVPAMRASGGAIVNISSLASLAGSNQIAYEVSKAAVNRLTLSTATTNAKYGVRCNAVLPGLMDTPMAVQGIASATGATVQDTRARRNAAVPMRRMGTAWDTAYAALFLASDEAQFITGVLLAVDGGASARVG